jgi:tetratricopeptide (TPR) repeat protein
LQYREHDLEGARKEFETALRLNQASFAPLNTVAYESYISLGQIADLEGRHDEALAYFQKATRTLPYHSPAYDILGTVYFPRNNYAKAAEYFAHAVQVNPQDLGGRFYLGTCWMKLGKYREAAGQFRAAREIDPTYTQAYTAEAQALDAAGDGAGAAQVRRLKPASE